MIRTLGDLIVDINMRLPHFPVDAQDIQRLTHIDMGPGGACNVAIMAARFGLEVGALGEVGDDLFGQVVRGGLDREGVQLDGLITTPGGQTPVATVLIDEAGEPAYLGHPGSLQVRAFHPDWEPLIREAEALYADGWAEHEDVPAILLRGFEIAQAAGVPVYFDPGPGNPDVDDAWLAKAVAHTRFLLVNREEAGALTGKKDEAAQLSTLLSMGPEYVLLKRGGAGLILAHGQERYPVDGLPVPVVDSTGAGDSVAAAAIYGMQRGLSLGRLAALANATGAAKVGKLGTGHNLPHIDEVRAVLAAAKLDPQDFLPSKN